MTSWFFALGKASQCFVSLGISLWLTWISSAGDIHIWDQESGSILHHVRAQDLGGDLTCIAWNHAEDNPFMFATGSHDGALRIWTKLHDRRPSISALEASIPFTRSSSPDDMDDLPRTESPLTQHEFESSFANSAESLGSGPSSASGHRERMVAFAAAHTVGATDSDVSPWTKNETKYDLLR